MARTSEGAGAMLYDQQSRLKREERERRAERKKRRAAQPEGQGGKLSEPFAGEADAS